MLHAAARTTRAHWLERHCYGLQAHITGGGLGGIHWPGAPGHLSPKTNIREQCGLHYGNEWLLMMPSIYMKLLHLQGFIPAGPLPCFVPSVHIVQHVEKQAVEYY